MSSKKQPTKKVVKPKAKSRPKRASKTESQVKRDNETGKFVKGTRPPGRPKGSVSLVAQLRKILQEQYADGTTRGQRVMEVLLKRANDGDIAAIRTVLERIDGKVPDTLNVVNPPQFVLPPNNEGGKRK